MRALALSVIFILVFMLGLSVYYMNSTFFSASGAAVRNAEAQLRDGCNMLKNVHKCDVGIIGSISFVYVSAGKASDYYSLMELCNARGYKTPSECAMLCGCY